LAPDRYDGSALVVADLHPRPGRHSAAPAWMAVIAIV
jgi:hypothetical protein